MKYLILLSIMLLAACEDASGPTLIGSNPPVPGNCVEYADGSGKYGKVINRVNSPDGLVHHVRETKKDGSEGTVVQKFREDIVVIDCQLLLYQNQR